MRILYVSERPPYPLFLGGAARCAHQLLASIAEQGFAECMAVGSADYAQTAWSYPLPADFASLDVRSVTTAQGGAAEISHGVTGTIDCGYPVHLVAGFPADLSTLIGDFKPDVVWAQLEGARDVLTLACSKGVQGLLYVHDAEFDPADLRHAARLGCHVVCSSAFLARKAGGFLGYTPHVVYPASDWFFGTRGNTSDFVTMINPYPVKGVDTFLEVARRMPHRRFLLVESWKLDGTALSVLRSRLQDLPNVRFQRRVSDMRDIYSQTQVLLVPSIWEEGFGMVAVEAQSCGIPVIASERGGLPESVGSGGMLIRDYRNVAAWTHALGEMLNDDDTYRAWSTRALAHARSAAFDRREVARRFLAVCTMPRPTCRRTVRLAAVLDRLGQVPLIGKLLRRMRR